MKILWLSHNVPYPPKTGVLQRNYNLLKEAANVGEIYLIAFFQKDILPIQYDMQEVRRELGKFCQFIEIVQIPSESLRIRKYGLVLMSIFTSDPYSVNWMESSEMHVKIRQFAKETEFDMVHFDTIGLAEYWGDVGNVPKVLNHHNIESNLMERRSIIEGNKLKKMYFHMEAGKLKKYEKDHCKKFDINTTVSSLDKERLREMLPDGRIEVIPNGVDTDYFFPDNEEIKKGNIIFVGGMNWYPNRDAIMFLCNEIWPLLKEEIPEISLTVVGAQPPTELLDLSKTDNNIEVTGFVDDMRPYMRKAEIYMCPMRDGGGTRLKILDALAMGKAIVSTSLGIEGISVEPEKNVLIANEASEFVGQIKRLIENPELREKLGSEGRKLAEEKYSWKVIGKELNSVYRSLQVKN